MGKLVDWYIGRLVGGELGRCVQSGGWQLSVIRVLVVVLLKRLVLSAVEGRGGLLVCGPGGPTWTRSGWHRGASVGGAGG